MTPLRRARYLPIGASAIAAALLAGCGATTEAPQASSTKVPAKARASATPSQVVEPTATSVAKPGKKSSGRPAFAVPATTLDQQFRVGRITYKDSTKVYGPKRTRQGTQAALDIVKRFTFENAMVANQKPRMADMEPLLGLMYGTAKADLRRQSQAIFSKSLYREFDANESAMFHAMVVLRQFGWRPTEGQEWAPGPHTKNRRISDIVVSVDDASRLQVEYKVHADLRFNQVKAVKDRSAGAYLLPVDIDMKQGLIWDNGWKIDTWFGSWQSKNLIPDPDSRA